MSHGFRTARGYCKQERYQNDNPAPRAVETDVTFLFLEDGSSATLIYSTTGENKRAVYRHGASNSVQVKNATGLVLVLSGAPAPHARPSQAPIHPRSPPFAGPLLPLVRGLAWLL